MIEEEAPPEAELLKTAFAVGLRVEHVERQGEGDETFVRVRGLLGPAPEDPEDDTNDAEWGALPFLFAIGVLSFLNCRPAGASVKDYRHGDAWHAGDLARRLRFVRGELRLDTDYVRGRRMKTRATVRADGSFVVETIGRGDDVLAWLERLRGKDEEPPPSVLN